MTIFKYAEYVDGRRVTKQQLTGLSVRIFHPAPLTLIGALTAILTLADSVVAQQPAVGQRDRMEDKASAALGTGDYSAAIAELQSLTRLNPDNVQYHFALGEARFMAGQVSDAVASFDRAIELMPELGPRCWQRGLALYYAGQFEAGRKQFESHQTVNRQDVENAVWHMLCVARASGVEQARAQMIPITADSRVPMAEIFDLFAGHKSVDDVMQVAAGNDETPAEVRRRQVYYAHLYVGLYHEMTGHPALAQAAMKQASSINPIPKGELMGTVADVHLKLRTAAPATEPESSGHQ